MINDEAGKKERKYKFIRLKIYLLHYICNKKEREKGVGGTKRERERERIISVSRNMYALRCVKMRLPDSCLFLKVSIGVKALGGCRIKGNGSQLCASGISAVECCPREYKLRVRLLA